MRDGFEVVESIQHDGLPIQMLKSESGLLFAVSHDLPGLLVHGRSRDEVMGRLSEGISEVRDAIATKTKYRTVE